MASKGRKIQLANTQSEEEFYSLFVDKLIKEADKRKTIKGKLTYLLDNFQSFGYYVMDGSPEFSNYIGQYLDYDDAKSAMNDANEVNDDYDNRILFKGDLAFDKDDLKDEILEVYEDTADEDITADDLMYEDIIPGILEQGYEVEPDIAIEQHDYKKTNEDSDLLISELQNELYFKYRTNFGKYTIVHHPHENDVYIGVRIADHSQRFSNIRQEFSLSVVIADNDATASNYFQKGFEKEEITPGDSNHAQIYFDSSDNLEAVKDEVIEAINTQLELAKERYDEEMATLEGISGLPPHIRATKPAPANTRAKQDLEIDSFVEQVKTDFSPYIKFNVSKKKDGIVVKYKQESRNQNLTQTVYSLGTFLPYFATDPESHTEIQKLGGRKFTMIENGKEELIRGIFSNIDLGGLLKLSIDKANQLIEKYKLDQSYEPNSEAIRLFRLRVSNLHKGSTKPATTKAAPVKQEIIFEPELQLVGYVVSRLLDQEKITRLQVEKKARELGIDNKNKVKELAEFGIVRAARHLIAKNPNKAQAYKVICDLYGNQMNISFRTSMSMILQQFSTPAPISYLCSNYIKTSNGQYFEPSAGNGLLTIALLPGQVHVNELDDIRLENLKKQNYASVTNRDASLPFPEHWRKMDGVITNPPFGKCDKVEIQGYPITALEHLMCIRALDTLKDTGRAAIIVGGHTQYDDRGRIKAGKNRYFLNYLYHFYNVEDVVPVDGHKLYSRQGTSMDVRLILINGRKSTPAGAAPLESATNTDVVTSWPDLFDRFESLPPKEKSIFEMDKGELADYHNKTMAEITKQPQKNNSLPRMSWANWRALVEEAKEQFGSFGSDKMYQSGNQLNYILRYPVEKVTVNGIAVEIIFGGNYRKDIGPPKLMTFDDITKSNTYANIVGYLDGKIRASKTPEKSTQQPNPTDPNIGREWDSPYGRQKIVRVKHQGAGDYYEVADPKGDIRVYDKRDLDERIKKDEYKTTSQYSEETRLQNERIEKRRAIAKAEEEAAAKSKQELMEGFLAKMSPMQAGKKLKILLRQRMYGGEITTLSKYMKKLFNEGWTYVVEKGESFITKDNHYWDEKAITQTGFSYFNYLAKEAISESQQNKRIRQMKMKAMALKLKMEMLKI